MYRDEAAAQRARIDRAAEQRAAVVARIRDQLDAIDALNEQLERRKLARAEKPKVALPESSTAPPADASLAALVRHAGAIEDEIARLEKEAESVGRFVGLLTARLEGRSVDLDLGPAPRRVPFAYTLAEFMGPWWWLVRSSIFLIPLWAGFGALAEEDHGHYATFGALVIFCGTGLLRARSRTALLRWGLRAPTVHVTKTEPGSSTYKNWPLAYARGWEVETKSYSGRAEVKTLEFLTHDGRRGLLTMKDHPESDGVVLYDSRTTTSPAEGFSITKLFCRPKPDHRGEWTGSLSLSMWARVVIAFVPFGILSYLAARWLQRAFQG